MKKYLWWGLGGCTCICLVLGCLVLVGVPVLGYAGVRAIGSSIEEWSLFGYQHADVSEAMELLPGWPAPKEYASLEEAVGDLERRYSASQEVGFVCNDPESPSVTVPLAQLEGYHCQAGQITILKWDVPDDSLNG